MNNDKILVIVTTSWEKKIWHKLFPGQIQGNEKIKLFRYVCNSATCKEEFKDIETGSINNISRIDLKIDEADELILLQQSSKSTDEEKKEDNTKKIIKILNEKTGFNKVYIAQHKDGGLVNELLGVVVNEFIHEPTDEIYRWLAAVCIKLLKENECNEKWRDLGFREQFPTDDIKNFFQNLLEAIKKNLIKTLSLRKHQIMNLFLDLDIDWQMIDQLNESKRQLDYLEKIREGKKRYSQKITGLKSMLENVGKEIEKYNSAEAIQQEWRKLSEHCKDIDSYLTKIDSIVSKEVKLEENDIKSFLNGNGNFDFHKWYCELGRILDNLLYEVQKKGKGKGR